MKTLFKDIFDKEILKEQYIRKELKIFYELKLDLYKPEAAEENNAEQPAQQPAPVPTNEPEQPVAPSVPNTPIEQPAPVPTNEPEQPAAPVEQPNNISQTASEISKITSSVVTEDEVSVNDENKIMRSFEGEIKLSDSQKDNIQTFEDILDVLSKHKKDGNDVIDDFCAEIITLCANQQFDQIKQKLDKKSKIWVELYYGYNKDDSVGLRFSKRQNSDTLTSTMLIDNEIVSAKFSIDKINQKIAEYRNYNAKKS